MPAPVQANSTFKMSITLQHLDRQLRTEGLRRSAAICFPCGTPSPRPAREELRAQPAWLIITSPQGHVKATGLSVCIPTRKNAQVGEVIPESVLSCRDRWLWMQERSILAIGTKETQIVKVLVTGGAGYLGSHVIAALTAAGHDVTGADLFETPREGDVVVDLTAEGAVEDLLEGVEVVVHTAAIHPWKTYTDNQYLDNNIKPVHHVLKAALSKGVRRVVYTSSIAAIGYGPAVEELPLREDAAPRPDDLYGCTKWFGEVFCQSFSKRSDLETVCIRPPSCRSRNCSEERICSECGPM